MALLCLTVLVLSLIIAPSVKAIWCYACGNDVQSSVCFTIGSCYIVIKTNGQRCGCLHKRTPTSAIPMTRCLHYRSPLLSTTAVWCFCGRDFCNTNQTLSTSGSSLRNTTVERSGATTDRTVSGVAPTPSNTPNSGSRTTEQFRHEGLPRRSTLPDLWIIAPNVSRHHGLYARGSRGRVTSDGARSEGIRQSPTLAPTSIQTAARTPGRYPGGTPDPCARCAAGGSTGRPGVATASPLEARAAVRGSIPHWLSLRRRYEVSEVTHCGKVYRPSAADRARWLTHVPCPDGFEYHDQRQCCYLVVHLAKNISQAMEYCRSRHQAAALVSMETMSEYRCLVQRIQSENGLLLGWRGWWTGGVYDDNLREFIWSGTNRVISRLDLRWLAPLLRVPYSRTCVWLVPQAKMYFGNYFCGQKSGFICEITL